MIHAIQVIAAGSRDIVVRHWDGRAVVYDCATGDTLFLDEVPSAVLQFVRAAPAAEGELVRRLAQLYDEPLDELERVARQALDELDKLGLVSTSSRSSA